MLVFIARHWFLSALGIVLAIGFLIPEPLEPLTRWTLARDVIVGVVLFATTLPLATREIARSVRTPLAPLLATFLNLGLVPALASLMVRVSEGDLAVGLMVVGATPCTIASAAVWTRRAGGNEVVALMVTVLTNGLCFLVTPLWLSLVLGESVAMDFAPLVKKLAILVLLPMTLAQLARQIPYVAHWSRNHRRGLSRGSQIGILSIVLVGAVHCGRQLTRLPWTSFASQVLWMGLLVLSLHVVTLFVGFASGRWLGLSRRDWIAVGIAGSQKTLMLGLQTALMVGGGFVVLPMVAYHVLQLVVDTLVADWLHRHAPAEEAESRVDAPKNA